MRARLALSLGLVVLVGLGSTVHAVRREGAATERAKRAALDAVQLEVIPPDQVGVVPVTPRSDQSSYGVSLLNSGTTAVVVRSLSWQGDLTARVDRVVEPGSTVYVLLPLPACPATRVTEPVTEVVARVEASGGAKALTLPFPTEIAAHEELNARCGLFRASESFEAATTVVSSGPGDVVLDVALAFSGTRPTDLLAVRAADGVEATVTEALPLHVPLRQQTRVYQPLARTFTVHLRMRDCGPVEASQDRQRDFDNGNVPDPVWSELGLDVQRPGDVVERINLSFLFDAANALAARCDVQRLESEGG